MPGNDEEWWNASARLGEQRQLPRRVIARALVGEWGRIVAGEAMVGELRPLRIAPLVAHRAVNAFDREEGERIRADEAPHLLDGVGRGEQLFALRRVDAVII